jgi:transcriptional regulator with XRE-family HTH domain
MKISKALQRFLDESKKSDSYWVERAKLDFSTSLEKQRLFSKVTYADIAKKLGTSAAYISKVFRGDTNMTIETLVKLSRATGGELDIRVVESSAESQKWDVKQLPIKAKLAIHATASTQTVVYLSDYTAANNDAFRWARDAA